MADFIELTKILEYKEPPYESMVRIVISKYHIIYIEDDARHEQSFIKYNGEQIKVKESAQEILEKINS